MLDAESSGSNPVLLLLLFGVLIFIRIASLEDTINDEDSQTNNKNKNLEESQIKITTRQQENELIKSSTLESIWAVLVSVIAGQLLV